jgi:hypothetical protein
MFREMVRQSKQLSREDSIKILRKQRRGVRKVGILVKLFLINSRVSILYPSLIMSLLL